MSTLGEIKKLLLEISPEERLSVFEALRSEFPIHPLEVQWNTKAEVILEAISRANDITQRGVRGIIAEAAFNVYVLDQSSRWKNVTPAGDHAYDFMLRDEVGEVRLQVKLQRMKAQRPMFANEGRRFLPSDMFVAETQKTRGGKDSSGEDTRPYRFGEFDLLGVSLHPSTKHWRDFVYTVSDWLIPDPDAAGKIFKWQPVSAIENEDWTKDFDTCVEWLRSGRKKTICEGRITFPQPKTRTS